MTSSFSSGRTNNGLGVDLDLNKADQPRHRGNGDPTGASDNPLDAETVEHLQALMDRAVTFHRIEQTETGKIRKELASEKGQSNQS
jgi:hypothetical protein